MNWNRLFGDVGRMPDDRARLGCGCNGRCGECAAQLGDIVCSAAEYTAAADAVGTMARLFQASPAAVQDRYRAAVNAILADWNKYQEQMDAHWYNKNPVYFCNFKALGVQAAALAPQLAADSQQAAPPVDPLLKPSPTVADTLGKAIAGAVAAYAVVELGKTMITTAATRRRS